MCTLLPPAATPDGRELAVAVGFLRRSMRSDPRNDRCAPFATNRLVSGERTNRSYRVVPPRYPGTLFAASLLFLSSLSFENTRSTHTQIRCTVCPIISRRDCYSRFVASKIKGVVLERSSSSSSYLYICALYRFVQGTRSFLPSQWHLVDALGSDSFLQFLSSNSFTNSPPFIKRARAPFRPSVWHASVWRPPSLDPDLLRSSLGVCRRVSNGFAVIPTCWIGCSAGGSISVGESWNYRFRVSTIRLEYRAHGLVWPTNRSRTVQETVLYDLYAACCLKIILRVILVGELCVGRERRIYPRYSDPTNVVRELLSRVSFGSSRLIPRWDGKWTGFTLQDYGSDEDDPLHAPRLCPASPVC